MGGLDGRSDALYNSRLRVYQKYYKPIENRNVDVGELVAEAGDVALGQALPGVAGAIKSAVNTVAPITKLGNMYRAIRDSSENAEKWRMRNNAPGDLTGKAVWSKSRW